LSSIGRCDDWSEMKLFLLLIGLSLTGTVFAEWIDFGLDGIDHATITLVESTPTGMVIDVEVPGISIVPSEMNGVTYSPSSPSSLLFLPPHPSPALLSG